MISNTWYWTNFFLFWIQFVSNKKLLPVGAEYLKLIILNKSYITNQKRLLVRCKSSLATVLKFQFGPFTLRLWRYLQTLWPGDILGRQNTIVFEVHLKNRNHTTQFFFKLKDNCFTTLFVFTINNWISHKHSNVLSLLSLPPTNPIGHHRAPGWAPFVI